MTPIPLAKLIEESSPTSPASRRPAPPPSRWSRSARPDLPEHRRPKPQANEAERHQEMTAEEMSAA